MHPGFSFSCTVSEAVPPRPSRALVAALLVALAVRPSTSCGRPGPGDPDAWLGGGGKGSPTVGSFDYPPELLASRSALGRGPAVLRPTQSLSLSVEIRALLPAGALESALESVGAGRHPAPRASGADGADGGHRGAPGTITAALYNPSIAPLPSGWTCGSRCRGKIQGGRRGGPYVPAGRGARHFLASLRLTDWHFCPPNPTAVPEAGLLAAQSTALLAVFEESPEEVVAAPNSLEKRTGSTTSFEERRRSAARSAEKERHDFYPAGFSSSDKFFFRVVSVLPLELRRGGALLREIFHPGTGPRTVLFHGPEDVRLHTLQRPLLSSMSSSSASSLGAWQLASKEKSPAATHPAVPHEAASGFQRDDAGEDLDEHEEEQPQVFEELWASFHTGGATHFARVRLEEGAVAPEEASTGDPRGTPLLPLRRAFLDLRRLVSFPEPGAKNLNLIGSSGPGRLLVESSVNPHRVHELDLLALERRQAVDAAAGAARTGTEQAATRAGKGGAGIARGGLPVVSGDNRLPIWRLAWESELPEALGVPRLGDPERHGVLHGGHCCVRLPDGNRLLGVAHLKLPPAEQGHDDAGSLRDSTPSASRAGGDFPSAPPARPGVLYLHVFYALRDEPPFDLVAFSQRPFCLRRLASSWGQEEAGGVAKPARLMVEPRDWSTGANGARVRGAEMADDEVCESIQFIAGLVALPRADERTTIPSSEEGHTTGGSSQTHALPLREERRPFDEIGTVLLSAGLNDCEAVLYTLPWQSIPPLVPVRSRVLRPTG